MDNITKLVEMLKAEVCGKIKETNNLSEIEAEMRRQLQEVGRRALEGILSELGPKYPAGESGCPHCGETAQYVRRRAGQLRTVLGCLGYRRPYYVCGACGQGHYPLDEALGLRPNAMSAELERLAGMTGVQMSFGKGSAVFEQLTLVSLSDQSLDKAAQAYGQEMEQLEAEWQAVANDAQQLLQREREAPRPVRLYGALDATKVHTRGEGEDPWRDLKVGAWFEAQGQPPKQPDGAWSVRAEQITYYTDICTAAEFGQHFWATGVHRNAHLAKELIILGDGAEWIWNLVQEHFPQAVQIVDWFHACAYLTPVAKTAFKTEAEQTTWLHRLKTALWNGKVDAVIDACRVYRQPNRSDDPAQKAISYFTHNQQRMDYPTYRQKGYQIGSGTIESAAKQIGVQRMKVPGAIWNLESARWVAKARAALLSNFWDILVRRRSRPAFVT